MLAGIRETLALPGLVACVWVFLGRADHVCAQTPAPDAFTRAEEAYAQVDYESVLLLAEEALEVGGNKRGRVTRLLELIGISAAALGDEERAKKAFIRMLAVDPSAEIAKGLSPRVRGPFLEARGFWGTKADRLSATLTPWSDKKSYRVDVHDPLGLARRVRIGTRVPGQTSYSNHEAKASPAPVFAFGESIRGLGIEYWLGLFDDHDNEVFVAGTEDVPLTLPSRLAPQPSTPLAPVESNRRSPEKKGSSGVLSSPWFWLIAGGVVVGAGITTGVLLSSSSRDAQTAVSIGVR